MRRRLLLAITASAATGVFIYLLVIQVMLPWLQGRLTPAHIEWLREAFVNHPFMVLGVVFVFAAIMATPVLCVFRWIYGPLIKTRNGTRGLV